jgi:hypothetical protein
MQDCLLRDVDFSTVLNFQQSQRSSQGLGFKFLAPGRHQRPADGTI